MTLSSAYQLAQRAKHEPPEGWPEAGLPDDAKNILAAAVSTIAADDLPVAWTVWPHVKEPHGTIKSGTWRDWTIWLAGQSSLRSQSKMKCPGWALARFTKGYRVDHETQAIYALTLDCDDRGDWDRALATLADLGLAYLAYRSPTHGAFGACKWRLVVPLSEPANPERWPALYNAARVILGGIGWTWFDPSCANPSRLWFVGVVGDGDPREVVEREGLALDIVRLAALFDRAVAVPPATRTPLALVHGPDGRSPLARAERWLHAVEGAVQGNGGDEATFRVAAKLVRDFDLSDSDALSLLERWNQRCVPPWSTAELAKKIANARKYGSHAEGEALAQSLPSRRAERVATMEDSPPDPPTFVAVLMAKNTRVAAHWRGTGKANGDTSPVGYDWVLACDVIDAGGSFNDAVGALLSRPCGHAFKLGIAYAQKTVERVLERIPLVAVEEEFVRVESISVQTSTPPIYTLKINGFEFDCGAVVLATRSRFQIAVMEACNFVPVLPASKGGKYLEWVNGLLNRSTKVEMPPDASTADGEREEVDHKIKGLAAGDGRDGLERGCAIAVDESGHEAILMRPLFASIKTAIPNMTRPQLGKCLRALGWTPATITLDGAPVRVWRGKR